MNYIITNNQQFFDKIGKYNFCNLEDVSLPDVVAIDTETTALNPREGDMFAVQIGTGKDNYLIDMQDHNNGLKFEQVIPYLEGKKLVGHNLTFDLTFFYKHGFYPDKVMDTFIASKLLYNGYPGSFRHGFGYCMERELGIQYDKSEQKNIHVTQLRTHKTIQYSFNDVDKLLHLMKVLYNKLIKGNYKHTMLLHFEYIKALAYMENCGMPLDVGRWLAKMDSDKLNLKESEREVTSYIYHNLPGFKDNQLDMFSTEVKILPSISSSHQMIPVFKEFGINVVTDEGKESISEDQINKSDHEFVDIWLRYKNAQHSVSNFGQSILDKEVDGRIYTSFNPILDTARISTRSGGINFLNFPANEATRACIKAKEGYKMIVADYEGQENAVGADLHQDEMMLKSLFEGADLHCAFARLIFPELEELSDDEIKDNHSDKRKFSKSPRFAFAYGGTGYTVAKNQNLSLEEGNRIESLFMELHKGVYVWGKQVFDKAVKVGYIESAGGFKLHLPYFDEYKRVQNEVMGLDKFFWEDYKAGKESYKAREEDDTSPYSKEEQTYLTWRKKVSDAAKKRSRYQRLCLNNPVQTTSAHQTKLAVVKLFNKIKENDHLDLVKICNVPHDEIVLEVREDLCDQYKVVLEEAMRSGGDYFLTSGLIKMGADANVGDDWYEAK